VKANEYQLMVQCVEEGYKYGQSRAVKELATPTDQQYQEYITRAIIDAMTEWFMFEDSKSD
jgi:DNA-binding IclR family transcriptional regulator